MESILVEKIIIVNAPSVWSGKTEVAVKEEGKEERKVRIKFQSAENGRAAWVVVRNPGVGIGRGWEVDFK